MEIDLFNNHCIDDYFIGEQVKSTAAGEVSQKCGFKEVDLVGIACERFEDFGEIECCDMRDKTVINATNFAIADLKDEDIKGITFEGNKKVEYLPYKIYLQFPNLAEYYAHSCSIKEITKENFENLNRLQNIILSSNHIQMLPGSTFKGLHNLKTVDLSEIFLY